MAIDPGYLAEFRGKEAVKLTVPTLGTMEQVQASPQGQIVGKLVMPIELTGEVVDVKGDVVLFRTRTQNQQYLTVHIPCRDVVAVSVLSTLTAPPTSPIVLQ